MREKHAEENNFETGLIVAFCFCFRCNTAHNIKISLFPQVHFLSMEQDIIRTYALWFFPIIFIFVDHNWDKSSTNSRKFFISVKNKVTSIVTVLDSGVARWDCGAVAPPPLQIREK